MTQWPMLPASEKLTVIAAAQPFVKLGQGHMWVFFAWAPLFSALISSLFGIIRRQRARVIMGKLVLCMQDRFIRGWQKRETT